MKDIEEGHLLIENFVNIFFVTSLSVSLHNLLDLYIYISNIKGEIIYILNIKGEIMYINHILEAQVSLYRSPDINKNGCMPNTSKLLFKSHRVLC